MALDIKRNGYSIRYVGLTTIRSKAVRVFWPKGFTTPGFIQFTSSMQFKPDESVVLFMDTDSGSMTMNGVVRYTELIDISDPEPLMNVTIEYDQELNI